MDYKPGFLRNYLPNLIYPCTRGTSVGTCAVPATPCIYRGGFRASPAGSPRVSGFPTVPRPMGSGCCWDVLSVSPGKWDGAGIWSHGASRPGAGLSMPSAPPWPGSVSSTVPGWDQPELTPLPHCRGLSPASSSEASAEAMKVPKGMCCLPRGCGWGEPLGTTAPQWAAPARAMVGSKAHTMFPKRAAGLSTAGDVGIA